MPLQNRKTMVSLVSSSGWFNSSKQQIKTTIASKTNSDATVANCGWSRGVTGPYPTWVYMTITQCIHVCRHNSPIATHTHTHTHTHTIKVASTSRLSFALLTWRKIPGSPRLHNFNVRVPKCGSLGTRLVSMVEESIGMCVWNIAEDIRMSSLIPRLPWSGTWTLKLCRRGEPGIFSHVSTVKGRRAVERS